MKNFSDIKSKISSSKGFTLIELLVVIGVLGVLAAAVLTAINPLEQFARGRDGGRKSTVSQLGNALQADFTANGAYLAEGGGATGWIYQLQQRGELKAIPAAITPACANAAAPAQNGYCYDQNGVDAVVYVQVESASEKTKAGCTTAAQAGWVVWSSAAGKVGLTCTAGATTYPAIGILTLL
jgi:prepilin-type N-terminal cleavage/methylation domain-containing protein